MCNFTGVDIALKQSHMTFLNHISFRVGDNELFKATESIQQCSVLLQAIYFRREKFDFNCGIL